MQDFEKIKLGFDETYLEQQLSKAQQNFEDFAVGVRQRIDKDVFSDDALRRMYVASERLKAITDELHKVEQLKSQANTNDEVYLKRLEAQKQHLSSMQSHEANELERVRRGLPMGGRGEQQQQGAFGASAQGIGAGILAGTGSLMDAASGMQLSQLASGIGELFKSYRGKVDPETGERVKDPDEISQRWGQVMGTVAYLAVGQGVKGYEIVKQQDRARQALFQAGGYPGQADMEEDSDIIERTGMSRLEYYQKMGKYQRQTGGYGGDPNLFRMERGFGAGDELAGLQGTLNRRGYGGQMFDAPAVVLGLAIAEGLDKSRLPELLRSMQQTAERGYSNFDMAQIARVEAGIASAGGTSYVGSRAGEVARQVAGMGQGAGRGFAMSLMMRNRESGGLGMDYFSAERAAEDPNTFYTPEFREALKTQFQGMPRSMAGHLLSQFSGMSLHDADVYLKSLFGETADVDVARGHSLLRTESQRSAQYDKLDRVSKDWDRLAIAIGEKAADAVRGGANPTDIMGMIKSAMEGGSSAVRKATAEDMPGAYSPGLDLHGATITNPEMMRSLQALAGDMFAETGEMLTLPGQLSGERTGDEQQAIWKRKLAEMGKSMGLPTNDPRVIAATRRIAAQGRSQHQEGRAVDLPENVRRYLAKNDPTGEKYGLTHPNRLGSDDAPHYELRQGGAVNKTNLPLRITNTVTVEPAGGFAEVAKEHQVASSDRYDESRGSLGQTGPGTPTAVK